MEHDARTPTGWHDASQANETEPGAAGLGVVGLVIGIVSAVLALTVYLTLLAVVGAVIALVLGMLALGDERSRLAGISAIVAGAGALVCATVVLMSLG
ncbi:hypothetical protein F4692_002036 [Nocardioides cavernae]|uniref:DUF4190 domain-containing protein n=1 Tax=Nocardioides cavernae TaxID=1921566 RepID=A0A7Y9H3D4_9ACTN|nr:hypothetical protein [Nocardioides cavernae]NYE36903.1 hypothetical protein [Nocardioides cavernae]